MLSKSKSILTWPCKAIIILWIPYIVCIFSCVQKHGYPDKFTEISYDQLSEKNVPKGLMLRNRELYLDEGYGIVHSSDSSMALIINPDGGGGGTTAMRCKCDDLIPLGCIVKSDEIITCKALLCTSCKPVLQIYDGIISKDRFRK